MPTTFTDLDTVKTKLGISGTGSDAILTTLIEQATALIQTRCRRQLLSATYTEYPQGFGNRKLLVKEKPITSITSIRIDPTRAFTADSTLLTAGVDYALDGQTIFRLNGTWPAARQNTFGLLADAVVPSDGIIKVVYVAGYSDVPADLAMACELLVARLFSEMREGEPLASESLEDYSYSRAGGANDADPLAYILPLIRPYVRYTR